MSLKVCDGEKTDSFEVDQLSFGHVIHSPRKEEGDTPRQKLLRRQLRLKKGWQDEDVIGTFVLSDLKLNARGDCVHEGRIIDASSDIVGTVVVTMIFLEGTLEDFQQIKIENEEEKAWNKQQNTPKKADDSGSRLRASGIPVLASQSSKLPKTPPRRRSNSFRESIRQKFDHFKSPTKHDSTIFGSSIHEKENQAPPRKRAGSFTQGKREGLTQQDNSHVKRLDSLQTGHQSNLRVRRHSSQVVQLENLGKEDQDNSSVDQQLSLQGDELDRTKLSSVDQQQGLQRKEQDITKLRQELFQKKPHHSPVPKHRVIPQAAPQETQQTDTEVVRRGKKFQDNSLPKERPASWGLYPVSGATNQHSSVGMYYIKLH